MLIMYQRLFNYIKAAVGLFVQSTYYYCLCYVVEDVPKTTLSAYRFYSKMVLKRKLLSRVSELLAAKETLANTIT